MTSFDRKFSRLLLEICRYCYASDFDDKNNQNDKKDAYDYINKVSHITDKNLIILNGSDTSVACIAVFPDKNIVSYMGTKTEFKDELGESVHDWIKNFEIEPVDFSLSESQLGKQLSEKTDKFNLGGKVHHGFLSELKAIQAQVVKTLEENNGYKKPLFITGHSQGGALAALATRALLAGGFPVAGTYTFAAPRAGDIDFCNTIPETLPIHRIEFGDDIVPHVPTRLIDNGIVEFLEEIKNSIFIPKDTRNVLNFMLSQANNEFIGLGKLCYGSNKTKSIRVDLSEEQERELFLDRLWSLIRHPERWADHHHLAGTLKQVKEGKKGNYTALVSDFFLIDES